MQNFLRSSKMLEFLSAKVLKFSNSEKELLNESRSNSKSYIFMGLNPFNLRTQELKNLRTSSRFTLIEILMVCSLLAFLMAIMVGGYSIAMSKMKESNTKATIAKIETALESYKAKTGYYIQRVAGDFNFPIASDDTMLIQFLDYEKMKSKRIDNDGYLVDPYRVKYWYRCPGTHNRMSFDLESAGKDGKFGYTDDALTTAANNHLVIDDEDEQADNINNWE